MIGTIVFDIGNVLIRFDWEGYIRRVLDDPDAIAEAEDAIWGHGLWVELDRGVMSDEEILEGFIAHAPSREREIRLLWDRIGECVHKLDYAIPWIQNLKDAGRRVLYLSNYSRRIRDANPGALDFLPLMDGGVFSCDVGLIKPDRAIYAKLCETCGLTPSECLFIDDVAENVKGALDYGFQAFRFQSCEQARARIEDLLRG